jgi:hypothetical protein
MRIQELEMMLHAYQGNSVTKQALSERLGVLAERRNLETRPIFWDGKCGSIVGSALRSDDLDLWASELGLPKWLALCIDGIANGMRPVEAGLAAGIGLLDAIPVGADVSSVGSCFIGHLLDDPNNGLSTICTRVESAQLIADIASMHRLCAEGGRLIPSDWTGLRSAAIALRKEDVSGSVDDAIDAGIEAAAWDPLVSRSAVSDTQRQWVWAMTLVADKKAWCAEDDHIRSLLGQLYERARAEQADAHIDVFELLKQKHPEMWERAMARNASQRERPAIAWRKVEQVLLSQLKRQS